MNRGVSEEHMSIFLGKGLYSYVRTSSGCNNIWKELDFKIGKLFNKYKINPHLDYALGRWHRWRVPGHDPIDVLKQIFKSPLKRGQLDFGHVFFTDFFTKDGIPIPGLSKEYLGKYLVNILEGLGVKNPIKWLNLNGFDYFFGGISLYDSNKELINVLSDKIIDYDWSDYFRTFGIGAFDIYIGMETSNILLVASGIEKFVSGSIILYRDITQDNIPSSFWERLLENIPSSEQIIAACGFYLVLSTFKNIVYYKLGKIEKDDISRKCLIDISTSLGCFAITKTILPTILCGSSGGLLIPLLIGVGSSTILRALFSKIFKKRDPITESNLDLWKKSPIKIVSPWSVSSLDLTNNYWGISPLQLDSYWAKSSLDLTNNYWGISPLQLNSYWAKSSLDLTNNYWDISPINLGNQNLKNIEEKEIQNFNFKNLIEDKNNNDNIINN